MGIGIAANGKYYIIPQVISTIDPSGLDSVEQGAQGILLMFGIGTGVIPPKTLYPIQPTTGVTNRLLYPSDLLDALNFAINPSNETPGAQDLRVMLVNAATNSVGTIDSSGGVLINLTSVIFGLPANRTTVAVDATAKKVTLTLDLVTEIFTYTDNFMQDLATAIHERSAIVDAEIPSSQTGVPIDKSTTSFTGGTDFGTNQPAATTTGALIAPPAAGNIDNGTHSYKVTVVYPYGESVPTVASNIVTVVDKTTNGKIVLTAIPVGVTGATARKIYRTSAGNVAPWKLVATIADNTTITYTDNIADASLTTNAPVGVLPPEPSLQDWQDCFDISGASDIDLECLVSPDETVQVAWGAHLNDKNDRFGFTGFDDSNTWNTFAHRQLSIATLTSRAATLDNRQIVFQGVGTDDKPSYVSCAKYAGVAAGVDPPVPITNKDLATTTVEADLSDPEIEQLLIGGVAPPMRRRNRQRPGSVCSRQLTTWTINDNLFNREFSVGRGARAIEREIKNGLEQYVGQPGEAIIVGRAVATVDRILANATRPDVSARIVSYDRKAITGVLEGTVLKIFYSFVPILPINFPFAIGSLLPTVITKTVEINLANV